MGFLSQQKQEKPISRVKVLGVTRTFDTKLVTTINTTVYCLLVEYEDDTRRRVECEFNDMSKYLPYIDID